MPKMLNRSLSRAIVSVSADSGENWGTSETKTNIRENTAAGKYRM